MSEMKEAIINLGVTGMLPSEIAIRLGRPVTTVYAYLAEGRNEGHPIPRHKGHGNRGRAFILPPMDVVRALQPHAERRGVSVRELGLQLLETIADEGLVDAILDEGAPHA